MQIIAEEPISQLQSQMQYIIDRDELLRLLEAKLIQGKLYVYLAIKLTYTSSNPSIDIPSFCDQWDLTEVKLATAIVQQKKKGALQPVARQLELQLF